MGAMQNNKSKVGGKPGKRGSVNNERRLEAFGKSGPTKGGDWGACHPEMLQDVIELITGLGGACTFGLSRDQGAHSLTLMLDGERETLWFNGNAELDTELTEVIQKLKAMN